MPQRLELTPAVDRERIHGRRRDADRRQQPPLLALQSVRVRLCLADRLERCARKEREEVVRLRRISASGGAEELRGTPLGGPFAQPCARLLREDSGGRDLVISASRRR